MSDAELIALAALVQVEAVLMAGDNQQREREGNSPAWREGCGLMHYGTVLQDEMYRREQLAKAATKDTRADGKEAQP